jgi:hypothetical protein
MSWTATRERLPVPFSQIAALREEIRRAGRGVRRLRWRSGAAILLLPSAAVGSLLLCGWTNLWPGLPLTRSDYVFFGEIFAGALIGGTLVAVGIAATVRRQRRRCFRCRLEVLPREHIGEVVRPLWGDRSGDTRRLVRPLLREIGLAKEVTPAAAPDARGEEPSPAEGAM